MCLFKKNSPVTDPEGSRKLRFQDFMTTAQNGGKVVSLKHRPPLPPGKYTWYSFLLCGPGNVVGIVTAYGLDGPGIKSRWGEIIRTSPERS